MSNTTGKHNGSFSWAQFDSLPRELRELLANAPINGASDDVVAAYQSGLSVEQIIALAIRNLDNYLPRYSTETYGPEYPCQTYSHLITSSESSATRRSHISGARSARAARRFTPGPRRPPARA